MAEKVEDTTDGLETAGVVNRVVVTVVVIVVDGKMEGEVPGVEAEVVGTLVASSVLIRFLTKEPRNIAADGVREREADEDVTREPLEVEEVVLVDTTDVEELVEVILKKTVW